MSPSTQMKNTVLIVFYENIMQEISGKCRVCQMIFSQSEMEEHIKKEHMVIQDQRNSEANKIINDVIYIVIDSSDSETDDHTETNEDEININYEYSVEKVKCEEIYKGKIINQHKMVVKDAREVGYGMEADIEISVGKMKGLAKIKIYGPSKSPTKKNQCTNFISKYPNLDPNFSTKLSRKIVRPLIESYLKGQSWKEKIQPFNSINKEKSFGKRYIRTHVEKMHNNICDVCNNIFKSADKLKEHKSQIHKHTPKLVFKDTTNKVLVQPKQVQLEDSVKTHEEKTSPIHMAQAHECKQCNVSFTTKVELYEHNEKLHIHDTWPDSGSKRDVSLIKTSSVSEPKRKKAAEEDDMIERSRNMDRKIEEKRKKNDLGEMLRKKELEEKQRQEQIKTEIEEKKEIMNK